MTDEQERRADEDERLSALAVNVCTELGFACRQLMGAAILPAEVAAAVATATGAIVASRIGAGPSMNIQTSGGAGGGGCRVSIAPPSEQREGEV